MFLVLLQHDRSQFDYRMQQGLPQRLLLYPHELAQYLALTSFMTLSSPSSPRVVTSINVCRSFIIFKS